MLRRACAQHDCAGSVLHADDTTVEVLAPGQGRTRIGRLWAAVRAFGGAAAPAAFYRYSPDRRAEHAQALLGTCSGFLHADGYAGFNSLFAEDPKSGRPRLTEVATPLPSLPIERGRPGPGLLAHVAVAKYADGLPLYRQSAIYAREGSISTAPPWPTGWAAWLHGGRMAALLDPLVQAIGRHVCPRLLPATQVHRALVVVPGGVVTASSATMAAFSPAMSLTVVIFCFL